MRFAVPVLAAALAACAATPEPAAVDPERHAELVVEGFREANPGLDARLERVAAWAVFPDVEDRTGGCVHPGWLFTRGGDPRPVRLRCSTEPQAPAGVVYHALVVIEEEQAARSLDRAPLDLSSLPHFSPHDGRQPLGDVAPAWVITSERGGLLFGPRPPHHWIEVP